MADLLKLALRNVFRQKGRSAATLSAIVFGVVALILSGGFVKDTIDGLAEAVIYGQSGHLQVSRDGYREMGSRDFAAYLIERPEVLRRQLDSLPEVEETLLRMVFPGLLNNGHTDWAIGVEGVEPEGEARLGTYLHIADGVSLEKSHEFAMMIGDGVAQALDLEVGDWVDLLISTPGGAANLLGFEVAGIFQTFSKEYDARAVRIPLPAAQELIGEEGAHIAVIRLSDTGATERAAGRVNDAVVSQGFEVHDWVALNPFYRQTVQLYGQQFGFLAIVILAMITLSVGNAVNMNAHERAAEFGTMQACGARRGTIFRLILMENGLLGLLGAVVGVLLGSLLAVSISAVGIPMPPPPNSDLAYDALIPLSWWITFLAIAVGVMAPLLAALRPAWRTAHADIADSLRQGV